MIFRGLANPTRPLKRIESRLGRTNIRELIMCPGLGGKGPSVSRAGDSSFFLSVTLFLQAARWRRIEPAGKFFATEPETNRHLYYPDCQHLYIILYIDIDR